MTIDSSLISNFFLQKGEEEGIPISPMKLIKLVYIACGLCLAVYDEDILGDEEIEAWKHGPVIPSVYHEFKRFGREPIDVRSVTLIAEEASGFEIGRQSIEKIKDKEKRERIIKILDVVWKGYKRYSAWGLSQKTHEEGSPWDQADKEGKKIIDKEVLKKYYGKILDDL
ncbi:MAG: type II toxin-antitoxin system antitoxin SocA domain-containing protein [Chlamydiota bacterium]